MASDLFNTFRISIEQFYSEHKRSLPWRKEKPIPYEVWLSEIIMQQTRVAQGTPYFLKILDAFPTVEALAEAPEDELLALWTGLGYYNRARNLQKGARQIVADFNGELPTSYEELLGVSGIGPYTAAAIASICFGEKKGVVDGNVYRVLSRFFGISTPTNSSAGIKEFQELADQCIAQTADAGSYNQGIMEFGALHCTPKNPNCMMCPLIDLCAGYQQGEVAELPVKKRSTKRSKEHIHFAVVRAEEGVALIKRDAKGIWAGLHEFPRLEEAPDGGQLLEGPIVHKLSHKDLICHFWEANSSVLSEDVVYYRPDGNRQLGMPIIVSNFVEKMHGEGT